MKIFGRSVSFSIRVLGDGIYEMKVYEWIEFLGLGYGRLKNKRYGNSVDVKGLVYEELDRRG